MLQVSNLSVARGGVTLLCGVDFSLSAGQVLVLRGANGLGKTSLLRCIAGLQDPVEGQITAPETVAYSGHADGLKGQMTVLENLAFWASIYHGPSPDVALDAYDLRGSAGRQSLRWTKTPPRFGAYAGQWLRALGDGRANGVAGRA